MIDFSPLDWALTLLIAQAILGALDTIYHHELTVALPHRYGARLELSIHAMRSCFYGVLFLGIANFAFHGAWAVAIAVLFLLEICLTLWDFVVEDNSRKLPAIERIMHTVLAINAGAFFALYGAQLVQWHASPNALIAADHGWRGWILTLFAIGVTASGIRDGIAAFRLQRKGISANPFIGISHRNVLITGGTGFIGEQVVNQLLDAGHAVTVLTRSPLNAAYLFNGRARCVQSIDALSHREAFDIIINLAGAPIAAGPWTSRRKKKLLASRVNTTQALISWMSKALHKPDLWLQASAIGFYGVRDASESLDENAAAGQGFMAELCERWEQATQPVPELGVRRVIMRLGVVFGPGGALLPLLLPFRLGFGGRMGDGKQIMSWVHRDDVIQIMARAIENTQFSGVYNVVAPDSLPQADFADKVGKILKRPVWFHIPAAPVRAVAGEMAQLFFDGQRVVPDRLMQAGYTFRYPTVESALRDVA